MEKTKQLHGLFTRKYDRKPYYKKKLRELKKELNKPGNSSKTNQIIKKRIDFYNRKIGI